jgi:hypothetical protein
MCFRETENKYIVHGFVYNKESTFILEKTLWGWGLKFVFFVLSYFFRANQNYNNGDIVCHYEGDIISLKEYNKRLNKKISDGNLIFSYIQITNTKSFLIFILSVLFI